jgi:hypothetical protein
LPQNYFNPNLNPSIGLGFNNSKISSGTPNEKSNRYSNSNSLNISQSRSGTSNKPKRVNQTNNNEITVPARFGNGANNKNQN